MTDLTANEAAALDALVDAAVFASEPRTLVEIGQRLGLPAQRVGQLETKALAKLAKRTRRADWVDTQMPQTVRANKSNTWRTT
jgi:DNA-directed RNA polymerase sigma subunit (sigma70/sigma32)